MAEFTLYLSRTEAQTPFSVNSANFRPRGVIRDAPSPGRHFCPTDWCF